MAHRSIASLSLSFGLVSIPIKLYSATESSAAIRFKLMSAGGRHLRQQYLADPPAVAPEPDIASSREPASRAAEVEEMPSSVVRFPGRRTAVEPVADDVPGDAAPDEPAVVERSEMVKGYEFEKGRYVLFTADELKALEAGSRKTIDIVAFVPIGGVDPLYYDKAYFLAPDKRGAKPYGLLQRAMRETGRCAIGKWAFRSKEYVVQIRPVEGGMVLQQLLYAEEVRSIADLEIEPGAVGEAELKLATQLIERVSVDAYDPGQFVDEEKQRILAAVERKIAGQQVVAPAEARPTSGAQVVDLMEALRASLRQTEPPPPPVEKSNARPAPGERKPVKRAARRGGEVAATPAKRAKR